jgi:hypothetical protein
VLAGGFLVSSISYAINTAPTSDNVWIRWFIGILKFMVGQYQSAQNMVQGKDTLVTPVPRGTGTGMGTIEQKASTTAEVGPDSIKVTDKKSTTTETIIPTNLPPKIGE